MSGHSHQHVTTPTQPMTTPTQLVTTPTNSTPKQSGPTIRIKSQRKLKSPPSERKYASITKSTVHVLYNHTCTHVFDLW